MSGEGIDYVYAADDWNAAGVNAWRMREGVLRALAEVQDGISLVPVYVAGVRDASGRRWYESMLVTPDSLVVKVEPSVMIRPFTQPMNTYWTAKYRRVYSRGNCFKSFELAARWALIMGIREIHGMTKSARHKPEEKLT